MPNFETTSLDRRFVKGIAFATRLTLSTGAFIEEALFKARHKIDNTISPANHPLIASLTYTT